MSPVRFTARGHFDGTFQGTYHPDPVGNTIPPWPLTALFRLLGNATVVMQPIPPYIIYDGDGALIVEPVPGQENAAQDALARGHVLIRRAGVAGLMNAPGTAEASRVAPAVTIPPVPGPTEFPAPPPPPAEDGPGDPPADR